MRFHSTGCRCLHIAPRVERAIASQISFIYYRGLSWSFPSLAHILRSIFIPTRTYVRWYYYLLQLEGIIYLALKALSKNPAPFRDQAFRD